MATPLLGGCRNDTLAGADADDTIEGDDGDDTLDGGNGAYVADGGSGNDLIATAIGDDITGGAGNDTVTVAQDLPSGTATLAGSDDSGVLRFDFTTRTTITVTGGTLSDGLAGNAITLETSGFEFIDTNGTADGGVLDFPTSDGTFGVVCFAQGTRILTALDEMPAEALRGGGLAATVKGGGACNWPGTARRRS